MAMKADRIPAATVARLPAYVQGLAALAGEGLQIVSSEKLAATTGIQAPQIRRDLSYLGDFGTPGVGYDVKNLLGEVSSFLGLSHAWPVAVVGCGQLGTALAAYAGFTEHNFRVVAIFDTDPSRVGARVADMEVMPIDQLPGVVQRLDIDIAVLSTTAECAQQVVDRLVTAGVTSILNLSPAVLSVPPGVTVRSVDLAAEMQILSFHETLKRLGHASALLGAVERNRGLRRSGEGL